MYVQNKFYLCGLLSYLKNSLYILISIIQLACFMFKKLLSIAFLSLTVSADLLLANGQPTAAEQEWENQRLYIQEYQYLAVQESNLSRIPAAIIMAQAILESAAGQSPLAKATFNHFGIKCKRGENVNNNCYYYASPEQTSTGYSKVNSYFRKYDNVEESYRDHSKVLLAGNYANVRGLALTDYRNWAVEIQKGGYATDKLYASKLIDLIERHELYKLDEKKSTVISPETQKQFYQGVRTEANNSIFDNQGRMTECEHKYQTQAEEIESLRHEIELLKASIHRLETVISFLQAEIYKLDYQINKDPFKNKYDEFGNANSDAQILFFPVRKLDARGTTDINGKLATILKQGENLLSVATTHNKNYADLLKYNDLTETEAENLPAGYYIFLEPKADMYETAEGANAYHEVSPGQTMELIAQRYGIKIAKLYHNNLLKEGEEPLANERIYLNKKRTQKPAIRAVISSINNSQFGGGGR